MSKNKKSDLVRVEDILSAIRKIKKFYKDRKDKEKTRSAIAYEIAVIGEAANKISKETKSKFKEIPWKAIIGMRNILIHEYEGVEEYEIWNVAKKDAHELETSMKEIKKYLKY